VVVKWKKNGAKIGWNSTWIQGIVKPAMPYEASIS
jgi:hypothetical protein